MGQLIDFAGEAVTAAMSYFVTQWGVLDVWFRLIRDLVIREFE